ncbi:4-alpha-glucanotransferase [Imbroritus primus]|uniref:4-alpha-glucanotransferase n=1 Tax=Imbroritus primus TaxID=3058603 RepID=UPI003D160785
MTRTTTALTPLQTQARQAGLLVHWHDAQGCPRTVDDEVLQRMLAQLPADASCDPPALVTAVAGQPLAVPAALTGTAATGITFDIVREDGQHVHGALRRDAAGNWWLDAPLPWGYHHLTVHADATGQAVECVLAVAPPRCFGVADALHAASGAMHIQHPSPAWGIGVQVYSLRGARPGGIGDFGALATLCEQAAAHGAAAVAINPVHAGFTEHPERYSPYAPSSRLFLNPLYADPAACLGEDAWRAAVHALGLEARFAALDEASCIDWPTVAMARDAVLRWLHARRAHYLTPAAHEDFADFLKRGADHGNALLAHACFEAMQRDARQHGMAETWPPADCWRDAACLETHTGEIDFQLFAQWLADASLARAQSRARAAGMAIGLIADLAVGTDGRGSHAWWRREEILTGIAVGAPPDQVNPLGQNWGISALSPSGLARHGYRAFLEILRAALRHAGGLRIDHALGLARMWLVPDGLPPDRGVYLRYPRETLLRLIALESWRHRAIVIGENLGTVPHSFEHARQHAGMLGIDVLWFQREATAATPATDAPSAPPSSAGTVPPHPAAALDAAPAFRAPARWSADALATTTTHDLPTVVGWWKGRDLDWRIHLGLLAPHESEPQLRGLREADRNGLWRVLAGAGLVDAGPPPDTAPLEAILAFLGRTPGPLRLAPLEDLLGLSEQPNLPGTVEQHPNWRRRMPVTVAALFANDDVQRRIAALRTGQTLPPGTAP